MNKKILLFTLGAIMAGLSLGYSGRSFTHDEGASGANTSTEQTSVNRPRFGNNRHPSPLSLTPCTAGEKDKAVQSPLNRELKRYSRMSPEELWKTLDYLLGQRTDSFYSENTANEILLSYIYDRLGMEAPRQSLLQLKDNKQISSSAILIAWGVRNPETVMAYCREQQETDLSQKQNLNDIYISLMSRSSPGKAIDFLLSLPPGERPTDLWSPLSELMKKTPEKMEETVKKLEKAIKFHDWTTDVIAGLWAQNDWNTAFQWINSLPEEKKNSALGSAVGLLALEEAEKKLKILDGEAKETALREISNTLFSESTVKAIDWLKTNASEKEAAMAIDDCNFDINDEDPEFIACLARLPAGAIKDSVLSKLALNHSPHDPFYDTKMEDSISAINQISSKETRTRTLEKVLDPWTHYDPEQTKSWVQKSDMPAEKKKEYMEKCDMFLGIKKQKELSPSEYP